MAEPRGASHVAHVALVALAIIGTGSCGPAPPSDTGFQGAWTREYSSVEHDPAAPGGRSTIALWEDPGGIRFRWNQVTADGSVTVRCPADGPCEAWAGEHKVYEYRFRTFRREETPQHLFVECTGTPLGPEQPALHYISRIELLPGALELQVFQVERDGVMLEGTAPLVFSKLSDDPADGLRVPG